MALTRRSLRTRLGVVLATVGLLVAFFPQESLAAQTAPCEPINYSENFFAGSLKSPATLTGARAILEHQTLKLCTAPTNEDSASMTWVAVEVAGSGRSLVQIGQGRCRYSSYTFCTGDMRFFWAWGRDQSQPGCGGFMNKDPQPADEGAWSGSSVEYIVEKSGGTWHVWRGGVERDSVSASSICWTPGSAAWIGESWNPGDGIGGPVGDKYYFDNARYQLTTGGTWQNPNFSGSFCTFNGLPYLCEVASSDQINMWTSQ